MPNNHSRALRSTQLSKFQTFVVAAKANQKPQQLKRSTLLCVEANERLECGLSTTILDTCAKAHADLSKRCDHAGTVTVKVADVAKRIGLRLRAMKMYLCGPNAYLVQLGLVDILESGSQSGRSHAGNRYRVLDTLGVQKDESRSANSADLGVQKMDQAPNEPTPANGKNCTPKQASVALLKNGANPHQEWDRGESEQVAALPSTTYKDTERIDDIDRMNKIDKTIDIDRDNSTSTFAPILGEKAKVALESDEYFAPYDNTVDRVAAALVDFGMIDLADYPDREHLERSLKWHYGSAVYAWKQSKPLRNGWRRAVILAADDPEGLIAKWEKQQAEDTVSV